MPFQPPGEMVDVAKRGAGKARGTEEKNGKQPSRRQPRDGSSERRSGSVGWGKREEQRATALRCVCVCVWRE